MKAERGFTLLELMIVIAIIGILAAVAVPQYGQYSKKARFGDVIAATNAVKTAISVCFQEKNDFDDCNEYSELTVEDPGSSDNFASVTINTKSAITATGTHRVDGKFYTLTPQFNSGAIDWNASGDCKAAKLC